MENIVEGILTSPVLWLTIVILYTLKKGIYFVPQNRGYVIYTLGKYSKTLSAGLNFIIPYVQSVAADRNFKRTIIGNNFAGCHYQRQYNA